MRKTSKKSPVRWSPSQVAARAGRLKRGGKLRTGFAWYTEAQWHRLRELAADREALDDTYQDWLAHAEAAVASLVAQGVLVEKVLLDVHEAAAWCHSTGRPFNSRARSDFVLEKLQGAK